MTKREYVDRIVGWLMPDATEPELAALVNQRTRIYKGTSKRIHLLVKAAYLRGVRRGAACAWEAQQKISLRNEAADGQ